MAINLVEALILTAILKFRALLRGFFSHTKELYHDYLAASLRYRGFNNETNIFLHDRVFVGK